jgi:hypothetical protein
MEGDSKKWQKNDFFKKGGRTAPETAQTQNFQNYKKIVFLRVGVAYSGGPPNMLRIFLGVRTTVVRTSKIEFLNPLT